MLARRADDNAGGEGALMLSPSPPYWTPPTGGRRVGVGGGGDVKTQWLRGDSPFLKWFICNVLLVKNMYNLFNFINTRTPLITFMASDEFITFRREKDDMIISIIFCEPKLRWFCILFSPKKYTELNESEPSNWIST